MKMMKKLVCLLLAMILAVCSFSAVAENEEETVSLSGDQSEEEADPFAGIELVPYDYDDITVGNPTPLNGQFFTDMWGNATSDTDVRHLVTGYNLIIWDGEISLFRFDRSVVSGAVIADDVDGNRSYILSLYSDLYYSDGTPITARDYAFAVLLQCSPVVGELGGHPAAYDFLMGYEEYAAGEAPCLAGLRVISENMLMFTVKKESLPYFYELSRLAFYPYPIHAIAPGCAVYDDGNGAYIANADANAEEPLFNAGLLSATIMDPEKGYMSHPDPVSGPYRLTDYDGSAAVFEINPYFKGNEMGEKPRIKRITYTAAANDTMIQELSEGKFALLNKVTYKPTIAEGLALCMENPQYTRSAYPRIGLTYILFNPACSLVQEQNVRQAIAYCFDTQQFIDNYVGAFGLEVYGLYGLGQWMTKAVSGTLPYPGQLPEKPTKAEEEEYAKLEEEWDNMSLDGICQYLCEPEKAVQLLEEAGWTLNEQGGAFDPEKDQVRCKEIDGRICPLALTMGYQPRADVEQAFNEYFIEYLGQAGIRLTIVPLEFDSIVEAHNDHLFDSLDLLYLGDNFNISFDPALFFWDEEQPDEPEEKQDCLKAVYQELYLMSEDMDRTEPSDIMGYLAKWIQLQIRLSELLPLLPVYTNIYFDFYTQELTNYWIEDHISWGKAIVPARMCSIREINGDTDAIEVELSYAKGEGELDLSALLARPAHESEDFSYGALSRFPEYVRSQVPAEFINIYELVAAKLQEGLELKEGAESVEMKFSFMTPYPEGEPVYLLFGIPGKGSDVEWFVREGIGLENGSVSVMMERELCEKLLGIDFALAVVSR